MSILSVIQKTSDRLFQRARRELVYLRSNMPNCSARINSSRRFRSAVLVKPLHHAGAAACSM